ncbi:GIY-YIG nuclease family protein [Marinomonas atlantica]|uniref:GIY-YIG nuclease family protein n=1 Tax=Marinomonas atlantica TaxID=1806668 RepID=UPI0009EE2E93|nr:GIY-YIG nuclease family protein [Marinomonas atlantica]
MESKEIVYVLSNSAMPGILKIGKTTQADVSLRMNQLYTTGVPVPFECVYAIEVDDCSKVEAALHIAFGPSRVNPNREFFKIEAEQAIAILKLLDQRDVTPDVRRDLNSNVSQAEKDSGKRLQKRPNMNFGEMEIPIGSTLTYKDGTTAVEVTSDKKVNYSGQEMTLTAATREVMGIDYSVQPSPHWTYEGKLLKDIYESVYSDENT